jgi:hypothetical protein
VNGQKITLQDNTARVTASSAYGDLSLEFLQMWIHFNSSRFFRHLRGFNAKMSKFACNFFHEITSVIQTYVVHHSRFEKKTHMSNNNPELRDSQLFLISPEMSIINLNFDEGTSIAELKYHCAAKEIPLFRSLSSFGCTHPDHAVLLERR